MSETKIALGVRSCMAIVGAAFISSSMRVLSRVGPLPPATAGGATSSPSERDLHAEAAAGADADRGALPLGPDHDDRIRTGAPALRHAGLAAVWAAAMGAVAPVPAGWATPTCPCDSVP